MWIHIVAAAVFILASIKTFYVHYTAGDFFWADYLLFSLFFFCTTFCFLCSSLFHLFMCHSRRVSLILLRLDYFGVILHIGGNFVIGHYYFWYCDWTWQRVYLSVIPPLYAAGTILPMLDCFLSPRRRRMRMIIFIVLALACFGPVLHWTVVRAVCHAVFVVFLLCLFRVLIHVLLRRLFLFVVVHGKFHHSG